MMLATDRDFIEEVLARRVRLGMGPVRRVSFLPAPNPVAEPEPPPAPPPLNTGLPSIFNSRPALQEALRAILIEANVPWRAIHGRRRTKPLAQARHRCVAAVAVGTGWSLPKIGAVFGGRDHASVYHSLHVTGSMAAWRLAANASGRKTGFHERRGSGA